MTRVDVPDSLGVLEPLFLSRLRPRERFELARPLLIDATGSLAPMMHWLGQARQGSRYQVVEAAQLDGLDALLGQQAWGLFNPTRSVDASQWQFAETNRLNFRERVLSITDQLTTALGTAAPQELTVTLVPIDPGNANALFTCHGLSYFATASQIVFSIWPTEGSLARLMPALARDVAQAARLSHVPAPVTLHDHLVLEGLAAAFVAEQLPNLDHQWLAPFQSPTDWAQSLAQVAAFYGAASYEDLTFNIYGATHSATSRPPIPALPLPADELPYSEHLIADALAETNPIAIAAHLYGDAVLAAHGHPTVGLSPFAGFEVAYRLVRRHLTSNGLTAAQAIAEPAQVFVL